MWAYTVFPRIVGARSISFARYILRGQFEGALYSRARFISTNQRCISAILRFQVSCYATAVKLALGSPRDEEVLDGYVESDLLNNTSPGLALIV